MSNKELISKIKAEIERRKKALHSTLFNDEYNDFLSFLSTLESEKPMQEGLEKEIQKYLESKGVGYGGWIDGWKDEDLREIARNFYDLGCTSTAEKYDEIEYNRQRAEKSVPNDLEEAARHSEILTYPMPEDGDIEKVFKVQEARFFHEIGFIAGAKWQKEQDTREMIMSDGSYFQKCYELGKKDILSKFTKEHLEGLKWIERTGISTQPVPYHKYCKDLYKVLEEILKEKYDTQGDTSI